MSLSRSPEGTEVKAEVLSSKIDEESAADKESRLPAWKELSIDLEGLKSSLERLEARKGNIDMERSHKASSSSDGGICLDVSPSLRFSGQAGDSPTDNLTRPSRIHEQDQCQDQAQDEGRGSPVGSGYKALKAAVELAKNDVQKEVQQPESQDQDQDQGLDPHPDVGLSSDKGENGLSERLEARKGNTEKGEEELLAEFVAMQAKLRAQFAQIPRKEEVRQHAKTEKEGKAQEEEDAENDILNENENEEENRGESEELDKGAEIQYPVQDPVRDQDQESKKEAQMGRKQERSSEDKDQDLDLEPPRRSPTPCIGIATPFGVYRRPCPKPSSPVPKIDQNNTTTATITPPFVFGQPGISSSPNADLYGDEILPRTGQGSVAFKITEVTADDITTIQK